MAKKRGSLNQRVGRNLRAHRVALGYSQEGYAHHLSIDRAFWARLERGERNLSLDRLEELAKQMNVDPIKLIADEPHLPRETR